jgi:TM2 domain-containing membrane protein YozV/RNA polymerase subunit RPABC4/transcription elongation factor Spt4
MALISCRECSREISSEAPACPHCGAPSKPAPAVALILCRECRRGFAGDAPACPHCGAPKALDATCRNCHFPVSAGATVCPQCGAVGPVRGYPGAAPASPSVLLVQARKSRGVFIVLGLFLGCLGIHNFYAGYYAKGAVQLAVTLVLGWIIIGFVITVIWALIEIITVTADAEGHAMA